MQGLTWTKIGVVLLVLSIPAGLTWAQEQLSPTLVNEKDGAQMVLIPAGEFTMGSKDWYPDEQPPHKVYLEAFYIDKYEVSNAQYKKFVQEAGHRKPFNQTNPKYDLWQHDGSFPAGVAQLPVTNICWDDARAYAKWAGKRLPTEAEWEKAARGTDQRRYPWGNEPPDAKRANFARRWEGHKTFKEVSALAAGASPYGVFQMAGNVAEWVADRYDPHYYKTSPQKTPYGGFSETYRVIRGGSYISPEFYLRCTDRDFDMPDDCNSTVGFRCVRQP